MKMPARIQRKDKKGWRMPAGAVYVGRPTIWGFGWGTGRQARRHSTVSGGASEKRSASRFRFAKVRGMN